MSLNVGFLTTHPIQYQVPVFRHLGDFDDINLTVFYCMELDAAQQGTGFGVPFKWDLPLLEGYEYEVLSNVSPNPGVTYFSGCNTPEIGERISARKLDALVINGWIVRSCLQGLLACLRRGIPCLVRGEANDLRPRAAWKRFLQSVLVRRYSACLYIGEENRDFYLHRGVTPDRLFPARYCIENSRFSDTANLTSKADLRAQYGITPDAFCLIFSGKLEHKKHPIELIQSVAAASRQVEGLHLLVVGDGPLRKECEKIAKEEDAPVSFAGFVNQKAIASHYAAADCLVLPSDVGETWGLVVNEAMASGIPAIVSNEVGCRRDLVTDDETGWVFQLGDWGGLASLVVSLAGRRLHVRECGRRAADRVSQYSPLAAATGIRDACLYATRTRGLTSPS